MRVIGIDPGLQNTGLAVLNKAGNSVQFIDFRLVRSKANDTFAERLKSIYNQITEFLQHHAPDVVALEEVYYAKNAQVALKMGHARGAAILAVANQNIAVAEYAPREIKLAVTGNGNASKHQVQQMILRILNISEIPPTYDITDAMAVAYCHCQRT